MGRGRVNYGLILDKSIRRNVFRKRKGGLLKKISELTILCGIPACAIIYSEDSSQPEVWPSQSEAVALLDRLHELPVEKQKKHMLDQVSYLHQAIAKANKELEKKENRRYSLELGLLTSGCIPDEDLDDADYSEELTVAARLLERKIRAVGERIRAAEAVE